MRGRDVIYQGAFANIERQGMSSGPKAPYEQTQGKATQ
jgi:hypothetical protein